MIIFLCIYLVIGLIIGLYCTGIILSKKDIRDNIKEHIDKYTIFVIVIITCSSMMLAWPVILIGANLSNMEDKK